MERNKHRHDENEPIEFPEQKIVNVGMEKEVKNSFIQYAMSVIMSRALPDVRDGLKPVHRRILYAMYENHHTYDKPFYKSASTVGDVLGSYHPHGDSSVYDAMVRLAQPFSMRYPLIEGHGNFGNVDGDQAAAYRYTEARMSRLADKMLTDIEKTTVDFMPNFDQKKQEPTVLPARFPNLLVNGSIGIAVGMATNIPPHNLNEVIDGINCVIDNPDATLADIMEHIKGPDFPTYADIYGTNGILEAYSTGRGRITVRAKAEIDEEKRRIIITEIPYMVNKANLVVSMADYVRDKKIEGITEIRDETGHRGMRIVVEYRRDANGQIILNQLYKYTQLQDTCAVNMLALVNGEPKVLTLKQMLEHYIAHQDMVIRRRTEFDLKRAKHDAHIYEGYKIAIDYIDEVIDIIRHSESIYDAKQKLIERFELSDEQAQAIVDMTLGRLSGMERTKIEERLLSLYATITELEGILADDMKVKEIIKEELEEIRKKFGDERRTQIIPVENEIMIEDLIDRHTCVVTLTHAGYIKRIPSDTYKSQGRGGKGVIGMGTKEEDFVEICLAAHSHSYLMLFSNLGRVYVKKSYMIPEASRTAKGSNIVNILDLSEGEKITAMICVDRFADDEYLTMITKNGTIKRTAMSEYAIQRKGGKIALSLADGDELLYVALTNGERDLMIATKSGLAIRFAEKNVRPMGRTATGVRGIKLVRPDDCVVGAVVVDDEKKLLVLTERGYGKRVEFEEFTTHGRGGQGMKCVNAERTGDVAGIVAISDDDDIIAITDDGTMIRTASDGISVQGRAAGGVKVITPSEGAKVASVTVIADEEKLGDAPAPAEGTPAAPAEGDNVDTVDIEAVEVTEE